MTETVEFIELRALRVLRGENSRPLQEKTMVRAALSAYRLYLANPQRGILAGTRDETLLVGKIAGLVGEAGQTADGEQSLPQLSSPAAGAFNGGQTCDQRMK